MKKSLIILFVLSGELTFAQNRNSVWCFGDSALIDFSDTSNIIVGSCGLDTRGSCVSIANENGKLLFYAETRATISGNTTLVFDTTHQVMQNGNNIVGRGWYQELVIVPNPANDSTYYLFSIGVTSIYGLYYSIIDMRLNNGLGAVTVKNVQLQSFEQVDCLNAVKHGNGRDWWLIFRNSEALTFGSNNDWYSYLITPDSIQKFSVQSIGSLNRTGGAHTNFSPDGEKLVFTNWLGLIELYDFDRCSGLLSNPVTIEPDVGVPPFPYTWSNAFSPDASKLYVTTADDTTYLFQYDLNAPNISQSKNTLWTTNYPIYTGGGLKLAPDNKIYLASIYYNGVQFPYPYQDTVYNMYNMNLSVINQPDSLGTACNFQPYSFYLGGKRTYVGLPNNPDYDLGVVAGSACDTITGIAPLATSAKGAELFVTYIASWQKLFVNAQHLKGKSITLTIYDVTGNLIYNTARALSPSGVGGSAGGYFTQDINCSALAKGMYIVSLQTEKERLVNKFVVE
jgi:hypothetical protein